MNPESTKQKYKVIYEPTGAAREYAELALNLFEGCTHGCTYCYAPRCMRKNRDLFHAAYRVRPNIIALAHEDFQRMAANGDTRRVLMCFTCDPFQSIETARVTSAVIDCAARCGIPVSILTKGTFRHFCEALPSIAKHGNVHVGVSLVWINDETRAFYEPNAGTVIDRIRIIQASHGIAGIKTWVSLEPVIEPAQALAVIAALHKQVDYWKIGKINHVAALGKGVDWARFVALANSTFSRFDVPYTSITFKKSLKKYL